MFMKVAKLQHLTEKEGGTQCADSSPVTSERKASTILFDTHLRLYFPRTRVLTSLVQITYIVEVKDGWQSGDLTACDGHLRSE